MTDYYGLGYQDRIDEINQLDKTLNEKIMEIKKIGKNGSTIPLENEVTQLLQTYNDLFQKLRIAYFNVSKIPSEMPTSLVNKRKLQIEELELKYNKDKQLFENAKNEKYKINIVDNGMSEETKERIKYMNNEQLLREQKYLISKQDERLKEINKDVKEGSKHAKLIHNEVKNQNEKLDNLKDDVFTIFLIFL